MIDEVRCLYNFNLAPGDNFIAYCWVILSRTTDNKRFKTTKYWCTKYSVCIQDAAEQKQSA